MGICTGTMLLSLKRVDRKAIIRLAATAAAVTVLGAAAREVHAASATWLGTTGGAWAAAGNWNNTPVPGSGDTATFSGVGNGNTVIDLGSDVSVGNILFDTSSVAGYTIGSGAVGSQTLTLATTGNVITQNGTVANNQLFNANLALATTGTYTVANHSATQTLTLAGGVSATSAGINVLQFSGAGNTNVTGAITSGTGTVGLLKTGAGTLTLSGGGVFNGTGVEANPAGPSALLSGVFREGTTRIMSGAYSSTGEVAVGGVVANGGAGQNTNLTLDGGSLTVTTLFGIGRGNGTGSVSSDMVLNNAAAVTVRKFSMGSNGGSSLNTPRTSLTLNGSATMTITDVSTAPLIAESTGSLATITQNGTSVVTCTSGGTDFTVGAAGTAIYNIASTGAKLTTHYVQAGTSATGSGAIYNKGTLNSRGFQLGYGGYGYLLNDNAAAGTANTVSTLIAVATGIFNGDAVVDIVSGALTTDGSNGNISVTRYNSASPQSGQINVLGGTLSSTYTAESTVIGGMANTGSPLGSFGNINVVGGTALFSNAGTINLGKSSASSATNLGILSLKSGGTVTADSITADPNFAAYVNFNNGTLRASSATSASLMTTGVDRATIYAGGATIDTNGFNKSIDAVLSAPTGSGVTSLTLSGTASGFIGTPVIKISGGGGSGATARAVFDPATGSITGYEITSPGTGYTSAPTVTLTGGRPNNAASTVTATATIGAVSGGGLTKIGAGTLTLTGVNTYTGTTVVSGGTLLVNGTQTSPTNVANPGILGGTGTLNGLVTSNAGYVSPATMTTIGTLNMAGGLTTGAGTNLYFNLSGASNTAGGGVNDLINVTGNLTASGATLVNTLFTSTPAVSTQYKVIGYTGSLSGGANFIAASRNISVSTATAGELDITYTGAAAGNLVWNSSSSGAWDIVGSSNWLNTGTSLQDKFYQGDVVTFNDTAGVQTAVSLNTLIRPASVSVNTSTNTFTVSGTGTIGGGGALTKAGSSTLTLNTANTYTGGTTINGGAIATNSDASLGVSSGALAVNAGTLQATATYSSARPVTLGNASSTIQVDGTSNLTLSGVISSTGTLNKTGAGTLTLTGVTNTFSGGTVITAGAITTVVNVGAANSAVSIGAAGTLNFAVAGTISNTVTGTGTITSTGATITGDESAFAGTFTHSGADAATYFKSANATSANAAYNIIGGGGSLQAFVASGGLTLNLGSLSGNANSQFRGADSAPGGQVVLSIGNLNTDTTFSGAILNGTYGTVNLTKVGTGTFTITGPSIYNGVTFINGGTLSLGNGTSGNDGIINSSFIYDYANLTFNRFGTSTMAGGIIAGTGSLTKAGVGTQIFTGTHTYTGATSITGGTLTITAAGGFTGSSNVTVSSGATLNAMGLLKAGVNLSVAGTASVGGGVGATTPTGQRLRTFGSLTVSAGGAVNLQPAATHAGRTLLELNSLSNAGKIDLADNDVILHNVDSTLLAGFVAQLNAGRNTTPGGGFDGTWNGTTGIVSSAVSASLAANGIEDRSIGYMLVGDYFFGGVTSFDGVTVTGTDLIVKYTRNGDADLSGKVDDNDVSLLGSFYGDGITTHHWYDGDFDGNGIINDNDVAVLGTFYDLSQPALSASTLTANYGPAFAAAFEAGLSNNTSAVPEPGSLGLLGAVAVGFLNQRRRMS